MQMSDLVLQCGEKYRLDAITMATKAKSTHLEQEVTSAFLLGHWRYYASEFFMELRRVGMKFVRDKIDPCNVEQFTKAFDELVTLGCLPEMLACTLYVFCKSHHVDMLPPYKDYCVSFPRKKQVAKCQKDLISVVRLIEFIENSVENTGVMEVLARHANCGEPPPGRKEAINILRWYIASLSLWCVPRKDILQGYAPVPCCTYAKIATGQYQFSLVDELLQSFGYRPDPKRQKRVEDENPVDEDRADEAFSPWYESLGRNYGNFSAQHPVFCLSLEAELKAEHKREQDRRSAAFKEWVGEKDLPCVVFDQLWPNQFDWKVVFAPPGEQQLAKPKRVAPLGGKKLTRPQKDERPRPLVR
jgi:hypothetical protein